MICFRPAPGARPSVAQAELGAAGLATTRAAAEALQRPSPGRRGSREGAGDENAAASRPDAAKAANAAAMAAGSSAADRRAAARDVALDYQSTCNEFAIICQRLRASVSKEKVALLTTTRAYS